MSITSLKILCTSASLFLLPVTNTMVAKKLSNIVSSRLPLISTLPSFFFSKVDAMMLQMKRGMKVSFNLFFLLGSDFHTPLSSHSRWTLHRSKGPIQHPQDKHEGCFDCSTLQQLSMRLLYLKRLIPSKPNSKHHASSLGRCSAEEILVR